MRKPKNNIIITILMLFSAGLISAVMTGCSENGVQPVNGTQSGSGNFDLSSQSVDRPVLPNPNIIVLTEAKVILKDIKIHAEGKEEGSCEVIKTGPMVLQLKLNTTINIISGINIPSGVYDDVKFKIHKLNPDEPLLDPDFEDANGRYSVVVKGSYYGIAFVFKSSITTTQKVELSRVVLIGSENTNITLLANPISWFVGPNNTYLDPTNSFDKIIIDKNIKENIHHSFEIFKDNDKNGLPDD